MFLLVSRLPADADVDSMLVTLISRAKEIGATSSVDDIIAWHEWDGLADKLPNYTVRKLIKTIVQYGNSSKHTTSSTGAPTPGEAGRDNAALNG
jgi:hypothetical protein